jgi:hypothetical protein
VVAQQKNAKSMQYRGTLELEVVLPQGCDDEADFQDTTPGTGGSWWEHQGESHQEVEVNAHYS